MANSFLLIQSFLSLPTFYLCTLRVPITILNQLDRYGKHWLWDKGDLTRKGGCLVSWEVACKSKEQGGLGIIDLRTQNTALLMKHLHKFYNIP